MVLSYYLILAYVKFFSNTKTYSEMVGCVLCYLYSEMISCHDSLGCLK